MYIMFFGLYMYWQLIFLLLCRRVKEELASISGTINLTVENLRSEPLLVNLLRSPGMDSQPGGIDYLESIPGLLNR